MTDSAPAATPQNGNGGTPEPDQVPAHLTPTALHEEPRLLIFGNTNPMVQVKRHHEDGSVSELSVKAPHLERTTTRVEFEPGIDDPDFVAHTLSTDNDRVLSLIARALPAEHQRYAVAISQLEQILVPHAGGTKPAWVKCNDPGLEKAVALYYGCAIGDSQMLLTNNGRDNIHAQVLSTSAPPATANYMALTANSTAPAATDTTLTAEIATASGGLIRAQATYAHTSGTNTTTLTKTFTANGNDVLAVTIAKIGVFNASSVGTMVFETLLNSTATLNVSGDNVTITETVTAG